MKNKNIILELMKVGLFIYVDNYLEREYGRSQADEIETSARRIVHIIKKSDEPELEECRDYIKKLK